MYVCMYVYMYMFLFHSVYLAIYHYSYLDSRDLWIPNDFATHCFVLVMHSIQVCGGSNFPGPILSLHYFCYMPPKR